MKLTCITGGEREPVTEYEMLDMMEQFLRSVIRESESEPYIETIEDAYFFLSRAVRQRDALRLEKEILLRYSAERELEMRSGKKKRAAPPDDLPL